MRAAMPGGMCSSVGWSSVLAWVTSTWERSAEGWQQSDSEGPGLSPDCTRLPLALQTK